MKLFYTQKHFLGPILILMTLAMGLRAQTTVVLRAGGDPLVPGDWGDAPAGTTNTLSNFNSDHIYHFTSNNASIVLNATWSITALSTVSIGDGNAFGLTYSGTADFGSPMANVITNTLATLTLNRTYNLDPSKTTYNTGSTLIYASGSGILEGDVYPNLTIATTCNMNGSTVTVNGTFSLATSTTLNVNNSASIVFAGLTQMTGRLDSDGTGNVFVMPGFSTVTFNFNTGVVVLNRLSLNRGNTMSAQGQSLVVNEFTLTQGLFALNSTSLELTGNITFATSNIGRIRGSTNAQIVISGTGSITNDFRIDVSVFPTLRALRNLTINRAGAVLNVVDNDLDIYGTMAATDGTINANGKVLLKSTSSFKGRIGTIGSNGSVSGNVKVEILKPADVTGWVNLCSGGVTGKSFTDWNSQFAMTCPSGCPNGSVVAGQPFTSVYSYDETANTTDENDPSHYLPLAGTSTSIDSKTGYWVYLGNGFPNSTAMTLTLSGTVNTKGSSGSISLTRTGGTAGSTTGWNLVANPYPSPISVASFIAAAGGSNIDLNSITAYNATTDTYVLYTTASNTAIPMGQAFMVRALNNTSFTPDESWKTATAVNTSIQKINSGSLPISPNGTPYYFNDFLIDLESQALPKPFFTQAYFTFGNAYTSGFDNGGDAYSMESPIDPGTPRLFSVSNSEKFLRNALPTLSGSLSIPLQVSTGYAGQYTFRPVNLNKLPSGACVVLHDLQNNTNHDLKAGPYTTTINTGQAGPQFELIITVLPANMASQVQDPLCVNGLDGVIVANGTGTGPWNYTWKDANATLLKYSPNVNGADTLSQLSTGVYIVDVNAVGTCNNASTQFTLQAQTALPIADFSINTATVSAQSNVPVSFTNLSQNASEFTWSFGNGMSVSSLHTNYTYNVPGQYTVKLTAGNGPCQDFDQKSLQVQVLDMPVGIGQHEFTNDELVLVQEGSGLYILVNSGENVSFTLSAYNALGQNLIKEKTVRPVNGRIDLQVPASENLLFVKLSNENKSKTFKVVH